MANLLDLKNKINSTKNTGQITKALEMVSAARQRKAQDFLNNSRFLREGIHELMQGLTQELNGNAEQKFDTDSTNMPKFFRRNDSEKVLVVTIMSQRGLCGAMNSNLFFEIVKLKKQLNQDLHFISVNKIAQKYLKNFKENIIAYFSDIPENPDIEKVKPLIEYIKENYQEYNKIYLAYTNFVKSGIFKPRIVQVLPLEKEQRAESKEPSFAKAPEGKQRTDEFSEALDTRHSSLSTDTSRTGILTHSHTAYSIEPDPYTVLNDLSNLYIDLEVYEAILSSQASEHSARMVAMKKATDNVKTLVDSLTLKLNKERQAKITQQMAEIGSNL